MRIILRRALRLCAALTALTVCLFTGVQTAPALFAPVLAESNAPAPVISMTVSPELLAAPADVTLSFTLENPGPEALRSVVLTSSDGRSSYPVGDISVSERRTFTHVHSVAQSELDAGAIRYMLSFETAQGSFNVPVETALRKDEAQPGVEFLRRISGTQVSEGGSVTLVYRVRNTGNVAVHNLTVTDPLGSYSGSLEVLEVGESHSFINNVILVDSAVSAPVLEYRTGTDGSAISTIRLSDAGITTAGSLLDVSFSAGRSMFSADTAEAVLTLSNGGQMDFLDLTVYDDLLGGVIADSIHLPVGGAPVDISHTYPLRGDAMYRWRIVGANAAGERIDVITDTVQVSAPTDLADALLMLEAAPLTPEINRRGYVTFTLKLTNIGGAAASQICILEETLGEAKQLAVVAPGDPTTVSVRYEVSEDTEFRFSAIYTDAAGQTRTAAAEPVSVIITSSGVRPESEYPEDDAPLFRGVSLQMGNSSLFLILLLGSIAVLVVLSVLLFVTSRRAKKARKERDSARRQRMKEEMGRTARFTPVKKKK